MPDQPDLRYIRRADQHGGFEDRVYIVNLDAAKLSVRFEDWIEPNLLDFKSMDLKQVEIKDYVFPQVHVRDKAQQREGDFRLPIFQGEFALDAPAGDKPWELHELAIDPAAVAKLKGDKVLDIDTLKSSLEALASASDELRTALEDLRDKKDVKNNKVAKPMAADEEVNVANLDA